MSRLIDADALMMSLADWWYSSFGEEETEDAKAIRAVMDKIEEGLSMLSAQPEPHWIPCSERLPEEKDAGILKKLGVKKRSEDVLTTVEFKGERMTVTTCTYDGKWDWDMKYTFPDFKIVAWMPLPEPYKEDSNE